MATVQFNGLITGLDTNALINGLIKVERGSIDLLQQQKVRFQAQQGVFTTLSSRLTSLKSSAQALSLSVDFNKRAAASSDTSVLTATADSTAQIGTHNVTVDQLAKTRSVQSTSFASTTAAVTTGTLTITVGSTNTNITIDATNNTLTGLKDAINNSGAAATASIVQVSTSDYRLVVQSKNTGTANTFTLSGTLTDPGGSLNGHTEVQAARDAVFFVNTLQITRSSNTVSDVITGVTLTLLKEGNRNGLLDASPTDPLSTVTVSSDTAAIKSSIQKFVDAYNDVAKIVNDQLKLDPTTKRQGALAGDPVLRGVLSQLRAELSRTGGIGTGFKYLSDIGISFEKDGTLKVNDTKLTAALSKDPTGVSNLFLSSQNGIGKRIPDAVDDFISLVDGTLTFRQKGINTSITGTDKKITREEARIAALEKKLIDQFSSLEKLVSQFNAQGQFLSQQLGSLSSASK
jgi:flagellar hook-associated protein 2